MLGQTKGGVGIVLRCSIKCQGRRMRRGATEDLSDHNNVAWCGWQEAAMHGRNTCAVLRHLIGRRQTDGWLIVSGCNGWWVGVGGTSPLLLFTAAACWWPSQPFPTQRAQSSLTDLRVGLRPYHTLHTGIGKPQSLSYVPYPLSARWTGARYTLRGSPICLAAPGNRTRALSVVSFSSHYQYVF